MKTYSAKSSDVDRKWYLVDASSAPLGRLSSEVAQLLLGKGKPMFTKHVDCGDYVVVINAEKLVVTGNKLEQKKYYRHSGFPGALKESSLGFEMEKDPTAVIIQSVRGMLPVNKLRDGRLKRLKVYAGEEHSHSAQTPTEVNFKGKTK